MSTAVTNRNSSKRVYYPLPTELIRENSISKQGKKVLELLRRDGYITRLTALHYGVANLTARIAELRVIGLNIGCDVRLDANGKEYGRWFEVK